MRVPYEPQRVNSRCVIIRSSWDGAASRILLHLAQAIFVNGLHIRQVECRISSVLYVIHASKTLRPVGLKKIENVSTMKGQYEEIITWDSVLLTASDSSATMVIA